LVEVAEKAQPPVCKIIDFKKFKYQEAKKLRSGKKGKKQDLKEIRFTPFIASKDYQTRIERAKEFLNQGHKVRLSVKFVGRQITRKEFGHKLLTRAVKELENISKVEAEPKFQGRLLMTVLKAKGVMKDAQTKNKKIS